MSGNEVREEARVVEEAILIGSELKDVPRIRPVPTGIKGLDSLFFSVETKEGRPVKKPLGGIPSLSIFNITGSSDTGKSIMVEQFAVKQASEGKRVVFVTVETPAGFVLTSIRERARAMGTPTDKVEENIIFIDAASHVSLRENLPNFLATLAHAIKTYGARFTVIDSVTGLYEHKEMMARAIVRHIFMFLKKWRQTALLVSQKRSGHEALTAEAAGGYAVGHIVDGTMVLAKELITNQFQARSFGKSIGEVVRLFRIDGCRMCGHDTRTFHLRITETGLIEIGDPLTPH